MKVSLISLFFLWPALCSGSHHEFTDAISHCEGAQTCEIRLKHQKYQISNPVILSNHSNVNIIGDEEKGSTVCFANTHLTHLLISNVDNVLVKNVNFVGCQDEIIDDEFSYFRSVNFIFGLSIYSCNDVRILHSNFSNFYGCLLNVNHSKSVLISKSKFEGDKQFKFTQGILYATPRDDDSTLRIFNSSFHGLSADASDNFNYSENSLMHDPHYLQGAGIFLRLVHNNSVIVEIEECSFYNCSASKGGAIFVKFNHSESSLNIRNSTFVNNTAKGYNDVLHVRGGAISIIALSAGALDIVIEECNFTQNRALGGSGGAISKQFYRQLENNITVRKSRFVNNQANAGGAMAVFGTRVSNLAYASGYTAADSFKIHSTNFSNNQAEYGGAILAIGITLTLDHGNHFTDNIANFSGGVFVLINSYLAIEGRNWIERNRAGTYGGVIYSEFSNLKLSNSTRITYIRSNSALLRGGAIYVKDSSLPSLQKHNKYQLDALCFFKGIQDKVMNRLKFVNNFVGSTDALPKSGPDTCIGNSIYLDTITYCSEMKTSSNASQFLTDTVEHFRSFGVDLSPQSCSISTGISRIRFEFEPLCKIHITEGGPPDFDCSEKIQLDAFKEYNTTIRKLFLKSLPKNSTVNLVFPGYISNISVYLDDEFNQPIRHYVSIKLSPPTDRVTESSIEIVPSRVNAIDMHSVMFTQSGQSNHQILDLCVSSVMHHHHVTNCTKLLIASCPEGFSMVEHVCFPNTNNTDIAKIFKNISNSLWVVKPRNMPIIISRSDNEYVAGECKSFKCDCVDRACEVNLLKPDSQCKEGLTGQYCTKCKGDNNVTKLLIAPVSLLRLFTENKSCYTCHYPFIWIPIYLICTVLITIFILHLRIDIFNDYTRSIAFYSSILYLYVVSCGSMTIAPIFDILSGLLSVGNLLVTQNLPFCLSNDIHHKVEHVTYFDNLSPFVYYIYLAVVYFLFQKIPCLQRYNLGKNIHFPMWTLFILTYSNLCVGIFVPFQCNKQEKWVYEESIVCGKSRYFIFTSFFVAIFIVVIPILLIMFTYQSKEKRIHLTENYEKRFRSGFKLWEVMKLLCRFIIAMIFPLHYIFPTWNVPIEPCVIASLICLLLLIVNSLTQPATNHLANHFESFCLFVLSMLGIISLSSTDSVYSGLLCLSPYVLFCVIKLYRLPLKTIAVFSKYLKKRNQKM